MRTPKPYRRADGTTAWRVRYRHTDGTGGIVTIYDKHDADEFCRLLDILGADQARAWWNAQVDAARVLDTITLDQWAAKHFAELTGITDGTRLTYERIYDRAWKPALGGTPLQLLDKGAIARRVNELSAAKSDKTVHNEYGVLATMLKAAVEAGHIARTPCRGIRLPRRTEHESVEQRFLTHQEFARLHDAMPAHYRPLILTLVGTGMRWGEAEALTVGDVDLERLTIRVSKAAKWNASKATRTVGPTKTKRSNRTITIESVVAEALRPLLVDRSRTERLFIAPKGGPLRHRTVWDDWGAACAKVELDPRPRIHDLRHTHVAWLIAAGVSLPVIQRRLGHEKITTTLDTYGHLTPDQQRDAAGAAGLAMLNLGQLRISG